MVGWAGKPNSINVKMDKIIIKIDEIESAPNKTLNVEFEDFIDGIKTEKPIKADLEAKSLGDFIQITGHVRGQAILQCDLCLEKYKYEIDFDIDELFAKNVLLEELDEKGESGQEIELKDGQFVTDLRGSSEIDICDLLYQSVILDFPNKKVCGINCKGGDIFIREDGEPETKLDPRMAIFKDIEVKKRT